MKLVQCSSISNSLGLNLVRPMWARGGNSGRPLLPHWSSRSANFSIFSRSWYDGEREISQNMLKTLNWERRATYGEREAQSRIRWERRTEPHTVREVLPEGGSSWSGVKNVKSSPSKGNARLGMKPKTSWLRVQPLSYPAIQATSNTDEEKKPFLSITGYFTELLNLKHKLHRDKKSEDYHWPYFSWTI